ncbi:hypothetical protein B0J14DRAFT_640175 [Halenospora varia]|nr:hypothetical protein B0J14DRAFT_640175 [Halenospora varia]
MHIITLEYKCLFFISFILSCLTVALLVAIDDKYPNAHAIRRLHGLLECVGLVKHGDLDGEEEDWDDEDEDLEGEDDEWEWWHVRYDWRERGDLRREEKTTWRGGINGIARLR